MRDTPDPWLHDWLPGAAMRANGPARCGAAAPDETVPMTNRATYGCALWDFAYWWSAVVLSVTLFGAPS